jgi:NADH-quinone oxidoreductase subunit M
MSLPILSLLIATPTVGALMLAMVPAHQRTAHRVIGAGVAVLVFLMSLPLLSIFDPAATGLQLVEEAAWIPSIGAGWRLGIDGVSLWIVLLTTFLTPLILIGAHSAITHRVREFVIAMLVLETAMLGALLATDLLLFYLFWELMLVPMYLLIGIWGGSNRLYATVKFFIYTMVGSLLMLVGIIYLYLLADHSFDYALILALDLDPTQQFWLFAAFGLAFAIKVPVFPFHTWLPDAHTEAPTAGSVILAGVLLKMGTYGFLRFALPLFPHAMGEFSPLILVLSVFGIVYGALVAWAQADVKKLVAYSSVSHLGFVMLGIVALNTQAVEGAILQMVNHGLSTGALFILVGIIYERRHTRKIADFGGLAAVMPVFTTLFIIVTMSSIGLPGTNGFIGEFLILSGAMTEGLPVLPGTPWNSWPTLSVTGVVVATSGVILGAIYMLSMVRRVFFGPITHDENRHLKDLNLRELLVLAPIIILIFAIGLFPNFLLRPMHASVGALVDSTRPVVSAVRQPLEMAASPSADTLKLASGLTITAPDAAPPVTAEPTR